VPAGDALKVREHLIGAIIGEQPLHAVRGPLAASRQSTVDPSAMDRQRLTAAAQPGR
jgi:hypothetical protein